MLTSWTALLGFMERAAFGAGDGEAEVAIGQLHELIDRLTADACQP